MRKGYKMSDEQRQRLRESLARPEVRQRKSEITKAKWKDPDSRQRRIAGMESAWADPETRKRIEGAIRDSWDDPEKRARHIQGIRLSAARPEVQAKKSASLKRTMGTPEYRERAKEARKGQWDDPKKRAAMIASLKETNSKPEVKEKRSAGVKKMWVTRDRVVTSQFFREFHAQRKAKLAEAWRPDDWREKPLEWRIIGNELLSRPGYMSNVELAKRLDQARASFCPYGETWLESVALQECVKFINKIRKWVQRPGGNRASIPLQSSA
jgi:hypothetical protein